MKKVLSTVTEDRADVPDSAYEKSDVESVVFGGNVKTIGKSAFGGCEKLKEISFNEGLLKIDDWAFSGCFNVKDLSLPKGLVAIGSFAFCGLRQIRSVVVPSVLFLGEGAFTGCEKLADARIASPVCDVPDHFFDSCKSLVRMEADGFLERVGEHAFFACEKLEGLYGEYYSKGGLRYVSDYVFYGCSSLKEIVISGEVEYVGEYAFAGCVSLRTLVFNGTMKQFSRVKFGENAFRGLKTLEVVCLDKKFTL